MKPKRRFNFTPDPVNGVVLSIQSHVVHGYVGNKASCCVLETLGFEMKNINSVQFCNHSGYPTCTGTKMTGSQLLDIYGGLKSNDLLKDVTHVQTGYIGTKSFLKYIGGMVKEMKRKNPNLIYLCDPVIGDTVLRNGVLKKEIYVPEELVKVFRDEIIRLADIITPNQLEAEVISGIEIKNEEDVKNVLSHFHREKGIKIVVLTSCELEEEGFLALYASRWDQNSSTAPEIVRIQFERKKGYFSGVGDVVASLILAWTTSSLSVDFVEGIERAFNTVQCMVENTESGEELKVVQCRKIVQKPMIVFKAKRVVNNGYSKV